MAELRVKGTGTLKLFENDNTSSVTIASPASLGADRTVTLPDGDVTLSTGTMPVLTGSTNNQVTTVTGANAIQGETNLTFDGTDLTVSTGNVVIGTSGKGIDFSAVTPTAGMTGQLLDDYEEGTFTPTWGVNGGGSCSGASAVNTGVYTKVGRICTISIQAYIVQTTGTVTAYTVSNLPFTSDILSFATGMGWEFAQTGVGLKLVGSNNGTGLTITEYDNTSPPANAYIRLGLTYQTA
jgi:hypothetical protein